LLSIIGLSADSKGLVGELIGEWLAIRFDQPFVERRTDTEANLAIETFYDQLDCDFRNSAMIAAVGVTTAASAASPAIVATPNSFKFSAAIESFAFKYQGLAHAFPNGETSRIQVTFDHLPGALEFVGKSTATHAFPSGSGAPTRHAETAAWYGFGVITERQYRTLERLSNIVGHGEIDSDLQIRLVESV
jgi:hypothetical protein